MLTRQLKIAWEHCEELSHRKQIYAFSLQFKAEIKTSFLPSYSLMHSCMHAHSPAVGRAPKPCGGQHRAPHILERLGLVGTPYVTQEDADHCKKSVNNNEESEYEQFYTARHKKVEFHSEAGILIIRLKSM